MQILKMDFRSQGAPPVVPVMQSDSRSRFIGLALYDGGTAYKAPSGAAYTVQYRGAGANNFGWYDTLLTGQTKRAAVTVDASSPHIVTLELAEQALRCPGDVRVNLCVLEPSTGYELRTFDIIARVNGAAYPDETAVQSYFMVSGVSSASWLNYAASCQEAQQKAEQAAEDAAQSADTARQQVTAAGTQAKNAEASAKRSEDAAADAEDAAGQVKIIANGTQGWFDTADALKAKLPTGEKGQWAIVGNTCTIWVWNPSTSNWKDASINVDFSDFYTKTEADAKFGTAYTLPTATSSRLGGVKVGSNLTVNADGTLSVSKDNVTSALGFTPAKITASTTDLTAGSSALASGTVYLVYE